MKSLLLTPILALSLGAQITTFSHIVVIVQENRTPDNLFYAICQAPYSSSCSTTPGPTQYNIQLSNWLDSGAKHGHVNPTAVPLAGNYGLAHSHAAFLEMYDGGKMDGAYKIGCSPASGTSCPTNPQYVFVDNSAGTLNPYLNLATQYAFADSFFQTNQGPSFPAHQFLWGGTSAPSAADDAAAIFWSDNGSVAGAGVGCAAISSVTVPLLSPDGSTSNVYPCGDHSTIADVMPPALSVKYYSNGQNSIWTAPNAMSHQCNSTGPGGMCNWTVNVSVNPPDVLTDIGNCNLASLAYVIPTGQNSDHPKVNDGGGPSWVASIVNAIGQARTCDGGFGYWNDTAILIVWDDWGGFYDHVKPTILSGIQGDYQYGFRVPFIFVSAYTPVGFISHGQHDFGSILRFIQNNFGIALGALGFADARATNALGQFYNLSQQPRSFVPIIAPLKAQFFLEDKRKPLATDDDDDR